MLPKWPKNFRINYVFQHVTKLGADYRDNNVFEFWL